MPTRRPGLAPFFKDRQGVGIGSPSRTAHHVHAPPPWTVTESHGRRVSMTPQSG